MTDAAIPKTTDAPAGQRPALEFADLTNLFVTLARALHQVGQPAHRVEETLALVARRLGSELSVFCLPTGLLVSLTFENRPETFVIRESPNRVDLARLVQVTAVADDLIRGTVTPGEVKARIDGIMNAPPRWGGAAVVVAYILSATAFAVFFGGGTTELIVSSGVGLVVGLTAVAMRRVRVSTRLFELAAAFAAAFVAESADWWLGSFVDWVPLAAGLIILLPGMSLFDAVDELANGHVASGGARLAGVAVAFLALAFGADLGWQVADFLPGERHVLESAPLAGWTIFPALICVAAGSTIRFSARPRDGLAILLASTIAVLGSKSGVALAGPHAGPFLAALLLGVTANVYARIRREAPELLVTPGLALLVPGSIGVRSLGALYDQDALAGINASFEMFIVAIALVAGLLFSNSLVRERVPG
jgi:uncharacterized membrane protein YjjP (DUF1212 family)